MSENIEFKKTHFKTASKASSFHRRQNTKARDEPAVSVRLLASTPADHDIVLVSSHRVCEQGQ